MSRLDIIKEALANKSDLIEMKKSQVKNADAFSTPRLTTKDTATKSETSTQDDNPNVISKTIVGNTYYVMDSHEDVHVDGCFTKTIKERANKIFHLHDHEYKITSKVGKPTNIYEKTIAWKDLGYNVSGTTTSLMMDTDIRKDYNERMFAAYKDGEIDNHSVGMIYVKIDLAADDEDDQEAKKLYDEILPQLLNKEEAEEKGYFFVVKEAKLKEISAVLIGSNTVTPTMDSEPLENTQKDQPLEDTDKIQDLINSFNNSFKQ